MAETAKSPSSGAGQSTTNVLRNIIVSVTSTVLGATAIYFLGFHKSKGGDSFLERKEATTSAWKSYMAYENAYTKNTLSYEKDLAQTGVDPYLDGVYKESEKFQKDIGQLMKNKGMDNDLVTVLSRRLENEKSSLPKVKEYINNIKKILADNSPDTVKEAAYLAEETRWHSYYKGGFERAVNDIQEIAKTLTERYGQPFNMNDFLVIQQFDQRMKTADSALEVLRKRHLANKSADTSALEKPRESEYVKNPKPKDIIGKWDMAETVATITPDGNVSWTIDPETKVDGTWKIEGNKVVMNVVVEKTKKRLLWRFRVARVTPDSYTLMQDGENMVPYSMIRIPE